MPLRSTVLVVDDDAPVRAIAALVLRGSGYRTVEAASAEEALLFASAQRIDVVLSDVQMPGMNGVELAHEMTRHYPGLPIVLMTGSAPEELLAGAQLPVVLKPFGTDALLGAIRSAMSGGCFSAACA